MSAAGRPERFITYWTYRAGRRRLLAGIAFDRGQLRQFPWDAERLRGYIKTQQRQLAELRKTTRFHTFWRPAA